MIGHASDLRAGIIASVLSVVKQNPVFSSEKIDWAGGILAAPEASSADRERAVGIVTSWRGMHQFALAHMHQVLVPRVEAVEPKAIVVSRLKRLRTIVEKCSRLPAGVTLSQMQDVGGIRIIVSDTDAVFALERSLQEDPLFGFEFEWRNDYITEPKRTGYRSLHRIYCYVGGESPKNNALDGLRIEMQIRSRSQHAWATANEVVGTFRHEDLKSNRGNAEWRRYFVLAGSVLALARGTPSGPNVPTSPADLRAEFECLETKLRAFERITAYSVTPQFTSKQKVPSLAGVGYVVIRLNLEARALNITMYLPDQFEAAERDYRRFEQEYMGNTDYDILLVFLENVDQFERAYPNYFADTSEFLHSVYPNWEERLDPKTGRFR